MLSRVSGASDDPQWLSRWVQLDGGAERFGWSYGLFSRAQLKFLANAAFVLAPFTVPSLLILLATRTRSFVSDPQTAFLGAVAVPLVVYCFMLRPFFGPHDWDLFSVVAVTLTLLLARVLVANIDGRTLAPLALWLVVATHLFVTVPFVWIGVHVSRPAGPFVHEDVGGAMIVPGTEKFEAFNRWR